MEILTTAEVEGKTLTLEQTFTPAEGKFVTIKDNLQLLTINYNNGGTEFKTGIHWKLPTGYSFVQLDFINNFGGLTASKVTNGEITKLTAGPAKKI